MLLINPQADRRQQLGAFIPYVPLNVPFGIGFLAGYLLKNGKNVGVVDEEVTPITKGNELDIYLGKSSKPYIFGISCLTANISRGIEIAKIIKEKYPDSKVVFGGIHPTVLPDDVLKNKTIDIVVRNEGEETLLKLYEIIKDGKDYYNLNGISYRDGEKIIHNEQSGLVDISKIPLFPYHLFEKYRAKYNFGFLSTSRGCPYECIFCSQRSITGRTYRYISTDMVMTTLDILINRYKQKNIVFSDDNFIVNKNRIIELSEQICKNKFNEKASFMCQARGDSINEEILEYLKKANFDGLSFGIETASDRLMELLKKDEKVQDNIDAIKLAKKYGFKVSGTFILGLPTETKLERKSAYELAKELDLDYVRFNNATPYPGTELYNIALKEGRFNPGKDWKNLNACGTLVGGTSKKLSYTPITSNEKELMSDIFWCNIFYSLRPKRIFKLLFDRTTDTAGWIEFPKGWYFKLKEWINIMNLICEIVYKILRMIIYFIQSKLLFKKT